MSGLGNTWGHFSFRRGSGDQPWHWQLFSQHPSPDLWPSAQAVLQKSWPFFWTWWPSLTSHSQSGQAHLDRVGLLIELIHEHTLIYLSIVNDRFPMHDQNMPKKAVSLASRPLPKKKAIVSSVAAVVDEAALCTEHHVHAKAPLLEPLEVTEAQQMAEFFAALADATRLRLVSLLAVDECCVCDLAERLGMTESAISHQLRALRASRLVSYRKAGRQVFYRLHDHHVVELYRTVQEHLAE